MEEHGPEANDKPGGTAQSGYYAEHDGAICEYGAGSHRHGPFPGEDEALERITTLPDPLNWFVVSTLAPVTPQEIVALLRDMPPMRWGFGAEREAWLARKRDLLARIEAEVSADA